LILVKVVLTPTELIELSVNFELWLPKEKEESSDSNNGDSSDEEVLGGRPAASDKRERMDPKANTAYQKFLNEEETTQEDVGIKFVSETQARRRNARQAGGARQEDKHADELIKLNQSFALDKVKSVTTELGSQPLLKLQILDLTVVYVLFDSMVCENWHRVLQEQRQKVSHPKQGSS